MNIVELEPVGTTVSGLSLRNLSASGVDEMRHLLATHGVLVLPDQRLVLPDQRLDDAGFVAFLRRFGDLTFTTGETPVAGFDDLNVVSNVGRTTPPRSTFHTDTSYVRVPPAYTALRSVQVPESGGDTLFSNQYRALDTLPPGLRRRVSNRTITHVVTGLDLDDDAETSAEHPVVRRHPISGRPALFLSAVSRCASLSGVDDEEARSIIQALFDHSTADENVMRHSWSSGDVVIWDNACVLHRADHCDVIVDRIMHRGMVTGKPAESSQ